VALRNKRNFRFWSNAPGVVLYRCASLYPFKRGGNSSAVCLWTGGIARIVKSTFIADRPAFELSLYKATAEREAALRAYLKDSVMGLSDDNKADKRIISDDTMLLSLEQAEKIAPQLAYGRKPVLDDIGTLIDAVGSGSNQGYNSNWRDEDYLAIGRKLQPLIVKEAKLLDAKAINVFTDKNPSGWYFSGWRDCDMVSLKGEGVDGSNAMGVSIKGSTNGGGATYRTKRTGADINLADRADANWVISFKVNTNGNTKLPDMNFMIYSLDKSQKTKELPLNNKFDAKSSNWQEIRIPIKDFENGAAFTTFAGFYIRAKGSLDKPFLIDDIKLEPVAK
jgi:hypothetical protein